MLFNSYEFIFLFLPITLFIFYFFIHFDRGRVAVWWLGVASLFFYAYWDWRFLCLFVGSIFFNYLWGALINVTESSTRKKQVLVVGLVINLILLGYFKYTNFFINNLTAISGVELIIPDIVLPIGISFFTFTQIAFLVDCVRQGKQRYDFGDYLLFVSFFPHLVAGPILIHNRTIPQFSDRKFGRPSARKVHMGILFFSLGLFKKIIIADNLAAIVDPLFQSKDSLSMLDAWVAAILYTFQIYFDFSAYSEMAVGLALLFNVRIPINFNSPYQSGSIVEFWHRWHMSLSAFLRDYLYIPLGGSRKGIYRKYGNLLVTMLLGGLWHGASWTFVIWGGLHGTYLAINHAWKKLELKVFRSLGWFITFLAVIIAWVFFRAQSLSSAFSILKSMFGWNQSFQLGSQLALKPSLVLIGITLLIYWTIAIPNTQQLIITRQPRLSFSVLSICMLAWAILGLGHSDHFIYFQF